MISNLQLNTMFFIWQRKGWPFMTTTSPKMKEELDSIGWTWLVFNVLS